MKEQIPASSHLISKIVQLLHTVVPLSFTSRIKIERTNLRNKPPRIPRVFIQPDYHIELSNNQTAQSTQASFSMLGFNFNLSDQLAFYASYHSNPINQLIHFIFVPLLLWTAAIWLAYTPPFWAFDLSVLLPPPLAALSK